MAIKKDREHFPVKTDPTPNWGALFAPLLLVLLVLLGDRLKTKVSHMEVLDDLNSQICSSEAGASFFKCFESHTSITRKKKNQKIKQKSINEKPHKKSRENDNF